MIFLLFIILVFLFWKFLFSTTTTNVLIPMRHVTLEDNHRILSVKVGTTIQVSLAGNATTGYTWSTLPVHGNVLQNISPWSYEPDVVSPPLMGTGGTFNTTWLAVRPGTCRLSMIYSQPWSPTAHPTPFVVTLQVT